VREPVAIVLIWHPAVPGPPHSSALKIASSGFLRGRQITLSRRRLRISNHVLNTGICLGRRQRESSLEGSFDQRVPIAMLTCPPIGD
jgi:hypothetical protein